MNSNLAIVGDGESILCFKSVGIDAYDTDEREANNLVRKLARSYKIIFITENLYPAVEDFIKKLDDKPYPIVIAIPSKAGSDGSGMRMLHSLSEKALGVDIIFNKDDKEDK